MNFSSRTRYALLVAATTLLCSACSSSQNAAPTWNGQDPACSVSGMEYMCQRTCKPGEIGPSGQMCINKNDNSGHPYCDCGTR